ncbi:MAG: hypothetical protein Fur002_26250 [Anaerolineales bacterium]
MKSNYRADIDGLRAIAVLAVILNHADVPLFSGGYVGVDIFFVISGYLITGIIARELTQGEFSLARFYERRVRRIFPALFAVLLFTTLAGALLYNAENFSDYGRSVIAATFFFSNVHFWKEVGYFDAPAQLKPLLHTWSLAVEEQFYIFFPLLMAALARFAKRKTVWALSALALASFAYSVYQVYFGDPSAAFYLPQTRIWELLIGCLLALFVDRLSAGIGVKNALSFLGLAFIFAPILFYSENTPFPGVAAAAPVMGAALILFSGANAQPLVNRLLSAPPMVFIGKISYSLYLWHWGFFIFAKYYLIQPLSALQTAWLLFAALAVSSLSWKWIEQPFRHTANAPRSVLFRYAAGAMALAALTGWLISAQ